MPPISREIEKKSHGPLIAVIVILVLIIVGGLYFLKQRTTKIEYGTTAGGDIITESLNTQSSSDTIESIEADLNATDLNNLDQGTAAVESEIQ